MQKVSSVLFIFLIVMAFVCGGCAPQKNINMPVVLLTDYGSEDYRISQLKGIIYSNNTGARVVDACHNIPAFDIATGAFLLDVSANEFPEEVVFIAIIAPYVNSPTRYLVFTNNKNQTFVLPDNGLLTYVVNNTGIKAMYEINNRSLFDKPMEALVAERIQGKVGALIASGYSPDNVGSPLSSFTKLEVQSSAITDNRIMGAVVYIDHYGNAVTNISEKIAGDFGLKQGDTVQVKVSGDIIPVKFGTIYSDVPEGKEIMFISNSLGVVQLSINLGNFADVYGIKTGAKIEIEK